MELRVLWTDTARLQLEDVFDYYYERFGLSTAKNMVKQILDRTIQLENNPHSGPKEPLLSVVHRLKQLMFGLAATLVVATLRLQGSPPAPSQKRERQNDHQT